MGTIYVKNGNWDEACAKLKTDMDARDAKFEAKIGAVFAPKKKPSEAETAKKQPNASARFGSSSSGSSSLSRSRLRG